MINIVLDATMLDTFMACALKFYLRFVLNKQSEDKAKALERGEVFHIGEEIYWNTLRDKPGKWDEAVANGISHMRVAIAKTDLGTEDGEWYLKTFQTNKEFWRVEDCNLRIIEIEKSFAYTLWEDASIGVRIVMIGKVDLLFSDSRWDICPMDHKSFERDFPIQKNQNQGCNYVYAFGLDVIYFNRIGLQTSYPPPKRFKRVPISYDADFLNHWRNNVIKWALRYLEAKQAGDWEENWTSCFKFNRWCEYHENYCTVSGSEAKEYKLNTFFKTGEPWDVSKSLLKASEKVALID